MESADDANATARRRHVHPQTIRHQLRPASELIGDALTEPDTRFRLRPASGLFGDALTGPEARFRLLLALRVRRLLGGA